MPRKSKQIDGRRRRDDLRKLKKTSKAYWNEVLRREGLMMTAGLNTNRISYVPDLEKVYIGRNNDSGGRVDPFPQAE
jgi:hypothetical protein